MFSWCHNSSTPSVLGDSLSLSHLSLTRKSNSPTCHFTFFPTSLTFFVTDTRTKLRKHESAAAVAAAAASTKAAGFTDCERRGCLPRWRR